MLNIDTCVDILNSCHDIRQPDRLISLVQDYGLLGAIEYLKPKLGVKFIDRDESLCEEHLAILIELSKIDQIKNIRREIHHEFEGPSGPKVMNPSPLGSPPMFIGPGNNLPPMFIGPGNNLPPMFIGPKNKSLDEEMYFPQTPPEPLKSTYKLIEFERDYKVVSHEERIEKRQTCESCEHLSLFPPNYMIQLYKEPHPTIGKCGIINVNVSKDFYCDSWKYDPSK